MFHPIPTIHPIHTIHSVNPTHQIYPNHPNNQTIIIHQIQPIHSFNPTHPMHYGEVETFAFRSNHKVANFGKLFLGQFSSKTWKIWHEAFLTPQKMGKEKK